MNSQGISLIIKEDILLYQFPKMVNMKSSDSLEEKGNSLDLVFILCYLLVTVIYKHSIKHDSY